MQDAPQLETIQLGVRPVGSAPMFDHTFLIYTDSTGQRFVFSGFPESDVTENWQGSNPLDNGRLLTSWDPLSKNSYDYAFIEGDEVEAANLVTLEIGVNLSSMAKAFGKTSDFINTANFDYQEYNFNSNSAVNTAVTRAELNIPAVIYWRGIDPTGVCPGLDPVGLDAPGYQTNLFGVMAAKNGPTLPHVPVGTVSSSRSLGQYGTVRQGSKTKSSWTPKVKSSSGGHQVGDMGSSTSFTSRSSGTGFIAPIVLDLDGDGIELIANINSRVQRDMDGDGYLETTAWVSADDGILAIDLAADGTAGADGQITQSREFVFTEWDENATTDLEGLSAAFDTNFDGIFDARDARWSEFRVWQDFNSDGESQEGELIDLATAGITSLELSTNGNAVNLPDGSIVHGIGDYQEHFRLAARVSNAGC